MTRAEYPWLLPSDLAGLADLEEHGRDGRRRPRTVRDWVVDTVGFVLAALLYAASIATDTSTEEATAWTLVLADVIIGAAACASLWARRRWPVAVPLAVSVAGVLAPSTGGALLVALFGAAVRVPFPRLAVVGGVALAVSVVQGFIWPDPEFSAVVAIIVTLVLLLLVIGWGMLVRARRQLVAALRERARRAEAEAGLRAYQAQRAAREAIAREMHDVLAHRLTLLSVHAGALEFRPDAPPAEVARAAGIIRDSAHEALQDLRQIIGVLRAPGDPDDAHGDHPQPTLATLDALIAESRDAGMKVTFDNRAGDPATVPVATGRTAYRIVQEALTNARKHAPGAEVTVTVTGRPGTDPWATPASALTTTRRTKAVAADGISPGLSVHVHNPAPDGPAPHVPGSGQGLIGLTERAALAGGGLSHGPAPDGGFTVQAWLPWPS
ncbi:sensor histidine kinase [Streptomyces sp. MUM 203J]|uniref:sensor histidine kinase n=1 Tax=Streptomyces sp. MUM 203J TaxID=2791990 RepID=UPI001F03F38F|nr:histidine kinase [Streptomyces sp. MUM 203J]MCH0542823.1 sensor histidine kinase [Streptomyces sp. MUM 203J]